MQKRLGLRMCVVEQLATNKKGYLSINFVLVFLTYEASSVSEDTVVLYIYIYIYI